MHVGKILSVAVFFLLLAMIAVSDIRTREIPDRLNLAVGAIGIVSMAAFPEIGLFQRVCGALIVSLPLLVLALLIPGSFGGGDLKLTAAGGLFLGWQNILVAFALAVLAGGMYGTGLLIIGRKSIKEKFAFGPFLCAGMAAAFFWGNRVIAWYGGAGLF